MSKREFLNFGNIGFYKDEFVGWSSRAGEPGSREVWVQVMLKGGKLEGCIDSLDAITLKHFANALHLETEKELENKPNVEHWSDEFS